MLFVIFIIIIIIIIIILKSTCFTSSQSSFFIDSDSIENHIICLILRLNFFILSILLTELNFYTVLKIIYVSAALGHGHYLCKLIQVFQV